MNLIEKWIESIFIKRVALSLASGAAAYLAAHSLPGMTQLAAFGVNITITIDPEKFADACGVLFAALAQGGHEYVAAKFPMIGKYI